MAGFSISNIIAHCFHNDNKDSDAGIGYEIIVFWHLMIQLGIIAEINFNVLEWNGNEVPMKKSVCQH